MVCLTSGAFWGAFCPMALILLNGPYTPNLARKRELFDWTTGGEQTPFPANRHHSYARVPFIIIFMTFCAFEGMDGVNTNEVCTDLLNVGQKKRLVTQAQHDCFQWGGDFASKLNLPRRRDALLSDDEKHGGSESRESRRFF
jgi:hypothetical protein